MPEVSARTFRFLLALAESEPPEAAGGIVGEETGDDSAALTTLGLLVPGRNLDGVAAWPGDHALRPILDVDEVARTVTCFHPDVGFVAVPDDDIRTWRLDPARLATVVGRHLGLPPSFRPAPLVGDLLWDLGAPRLDRTNAPMLFARRLGNEESRLRIRAELDLRRGAKPSILLTTARRVSADLVLPAVSKVVPIVDVLDRADGPVRLDTSRLAAIAGLGRPIATRSELPVECEESGRWIRINGTTCHFGGKQAEVIRRLYDAWANDEGWLREQEVLEVVESRSNKFKELFKGNADWTLVVEVQRGNCRLRVGKSA